MRVGIVGAGAAGLAAARELQRHGHEPVVFEKSSALGGRCATRRVGPYTFDTGATSIAPRGRSIETVLLGELDQSELIRIDTPIYVHNGSRVSPGDGGKNRIERYAYRPGNNLFGKLLAQGLDVRRESHVALFKRTGNVYELNGETFDGLILTPPAPQTEALLTASGERRSLSQASYRPCLSVLLGYELAAPSTAYHALIEPEQRHPLTWISLESVKCPGRAPDGCTALVVQLSPAYSRQYFEAADADIVHDTADFLARIFGSAWTTPAVSDVKRWKYSLPESLALFDTVNPPKSRLVVAGDALLGGRVEYAYETGVMAARMFLED